MKVPDPVPCGLTRNQEPAPGEGVHERVRTSCRISRVLTP